jgi:dihydropteroate synthase
MALRLTTLDWRRVYVMGVVNATPDSFSDGGQFLDPEQAAARGRALAAAGADLIDVGGESTRPGDRPVLPADEERRRVLPILERLRGQVTLSIDTYKAEVAAAALAAGAELVNDISGGALDPELLQVVARQNAAVVLGHLRGPVAKMIERVEFGDVVREVTEELQERVARAVEAGVPRGRILVDPGLGFGKLAQHNLALLSRLGELRRLGCPIVVGASRKSFLGQLTGRAVDERELATAAAHSAAILGGAHVVRVHDVAAQLDAVKVADAIARAGGGR